MRAMRVLLDPPRSAGPITLGMPFTEVEDLLRGLHGYQPRRPGERVNSGYFRYESGLTYSVGQDRAGLVNVVEIWRPTEGVAVLYQDISLFDLPADEVAERLAATTRVQILDGGGAVVAPDLLLALWRPAVPDDPEDVEGLFF